MWGITRLLFIFLFALVWLWPLPTLAQITNEPFIQVTDIDVDEFPDVKINTYLDKGTEQQAAINLTVNGNVPSDLRVISKTVGIQNAFLLDVSMLYTATIDGIRNALFDGGPVALDASKDLLAAQAFAKPSGAIPDPTSCREENNLLLIEFQYDHASVINCLMSGQLEKTDGYDPYMLLQAGIKLFESSSNAPPLRSIVLFSEHASLGGAETPDPAELDELTQRYKDENIRIHVVDFGEDESEQLKLLANETDGEYLKSDEPDLVALMPLWEQLNDARIQYQLSYTAQTANDVQIEVKLEDLNQEILTSDTWALTIPPEKQATLDPNTESLTAEDSLDIIRLSDAEATALISGTTDMSNDSTEGLAALANNDIDADSNAAEIFSESVNSTGDSSYLAPTSWMQNLSSIDWVLIGLPFVIAIVGFIFFGQRRQTNWGITPGYQSERIKVDAHPDETPLMEQPLQAHGGYFEDESTPFLPPARLYVPAKLRYKVGGGDLPKVILLNPDQSLSPSGKIRIGRKPEWNECVIDDYRISRLHATITQELDRFYIQDEGSTGGTYLNRRRLNPADKKPLKHNDLINFHDIAYTFELEDNREETPVLEKTLSFVDTS